LNYYGVQLAKRS